ncbi:MAG: MFS transporter [Cryobacterium sp.]|nr:MFS transporter [Cryobacterium sp.]MBX3117150.1 MFS transporter [Cryobacterium sp.]MCO5294242.1 MFS transporter [Homoserinimonas sp.]
MTRQQRQVLIVAILASFAAFLDGSVVNVALPAISSELHGGLATQQWVVDAYLITLGALILVAGSLSDVLGRVLVMRIGLWGFGLTSLICALAPTAEVLILARGFQGIAGALLVPSSLALIMSAIRGREQSKAIGAWTAWTSVAFIAGPIVGGAFVDLLSWRLIFVINVLPLAITLLLLSRIEDPVKPDPNARIDFLGALLAIAGIGGPVFALIEQGNYGWSSPVILIPLVAGLVAFGLFLWWQSRAKEPMMPLSLFRVRNFAVGNLATFLVYGALGMSGFILVVFLQQTGGWPATLAGMAALPVTIILTLLSSTFGGLAGRFGPRLFMALGPVLAGIGHLLMLSVTKDVQYWWQLLPGILLFGLGLSITVAPLTSAILGSISEKQAGIGSAVNNAVARVAGLVAVAALGIIVASKLDLAGMHQGLMVCAALLIAGGLISALGIKNPVHETVAN